LSQGLQLQILFTPFDLLLCHYQIKLLQGSTLSWTFIASGRNNIIGATFSQPKAGVLKSRIRSSQEARNLLVALRNPPPNIILISR